jgi:hypothetical protein
MKRLLLVLAILGLPLAADAETRMSASYSITLETNDSGGGTVSSQSYQMNASAGGPGALAASASNLVIAKGGFSGQLYEVVGFNVTTALSSVGERQMRRLDASAALDDGTTLALVAGQVSWSVLGPIASISADGFAAAGSVYQDTEAEIQGHFQGRMDSVALMVVNVGIDDFGLYAGDGLPDLWQVQYFGENNSRGTPQADPDADGGNNAFEFAAGLVPTDAASSFHLRIEPVPAQPMHRKCIFGPCLAGRTYRVQSRASLAAGEWQPLTASAESDQGTERTVTDLDASTAAKFYRVEVTYP